MFQEWSAEEDIWLLEKEINKGVDKSCSMTGVIICTYPEASLW